MTHRSAQMRMVRHRRTLGPAVRSTVGANRRLDSTRQEAADGDGTMRTRWLAACGAALLLAACAAAQAPGTDDRPTQLPPLLPVPPNTTPTLPTAPRPRVPGGEYDPGYFYLPERAPEIVQVVPDAPRYRWWVDPSAQLAWVSSHPAPQALRLRPPDLFGGTVQGLNIPLGGRT